MDTEIYKGERFNRESVLDARTHFKPTETFQYTHFSSCHPTGVKRGFVKGEALRLLRTNSSKKRFEENKNNFKAKLLERGYPENFIKNILSEVNFEDRGKALLQKEKENERILPFVTQYQPSVPNLKQILLNKWHLIEENSCSAQRNLQGKTAHFIQERAFPKRYTREGKTLTEDKTRT